MLVAAPAHRRPASPAPARRRAGRPDRSRRVSTCRRRQTLCRDLQTSRQCRDQTSSRCKTPPASTKAAYGELLAVHGPDAVAVPSTARLTSLGYSGEHFDARVQQQYLRARWYDPSSGRFNRLDPFAGNIQDPQSLHKYAYVHGDPTNSIDPSGLMSIGSISVTGSIVGSVVGTSVGASVGWAKGHGVTDLGFWKWTFAGTLAGALIGGWLGAASGGSMLTVGSASSLGLLLLYMRNNIPTNNPTAAQQAKLNNATSKINATPGYATRATQIQNMDFRMFSKNDYPAWAYVLSLNSTMYISEELLDNVEAEFVAAVLVHERKHTDWAPLYRASFKGEEAAYQEQSDYMHAAGLTGSVRSLSLAYPRTISHWFTDQAVDMNSYRTVNPAVIR